MKRLVVVFIALFMLMLLTAFASEADAFQCTDCHAAMAEKRIVHAPVSSGFCFMCHDSVDSSKIPHMMTSRTKMGLSYEGNELCFACHEKDEYAGNPAHESVYGVACTVCHDPHASENEKLLR